MAAPSARQKRCAGEREGARDEELGRPIHPGRLEIVLVAYCRRLLKERFIWTMLATTSPPAEARACH